MTDPQPAGGLMCCFGAEEKHSQAIDNALGNISTALSALDKAKDFIPVAGVAVAIPVLQSIVDQIRVSTHVKRTQIVPC